MLILIILFLIPFLLNMIDHCSCIELFFPWIIFELLINFIILVIILILVMILISILMKTSMLLICIMLIKRSVIQLTLMMSSDIFLFKLLFHLIPFHDWWFIQSFHVSLNSMTILSCGPYKFQLCESDSFNITHVIPLKVIFHLFQPILEIAKA